MKSTNDLCVYTQISQYGKLFFPRNLTDLNHDGKLDEDEFVLTMFFIHQVRYGTLKKLPSVLPSSLIPKHSRRSSSGSNGNGNGSRPKERKSSSISTHSETDWSIQGSEIVKYQKAFQELDVEGKKYLSGFQAKEFLMKSNLSQPILAQIWSLADIDHDGQLNQDEFCIAMYFIFRRLRGLNLPDQLPDALVMELKAYTSTKFTVQNPLPKDSSNSSGENLSDKDVDVANHQIETLPNQLVSDKSKYLIAEEHIASKQAQIQRAQMKKIENEREIEHFTRENENLQQKLILLTQDYERELEGTTNQRKIFEKLHEEYELLETEWQKKTAEFQECQKEHEDLLTSINELRSKSASYREKLKEIQEKTNYLKKQTDELKMEKKRTTNLVIVQEQLVRSASNELLKLEESLVTGVKSSSPSPAVSSPSSEKITDFSSSISPKDSSMDAKNTPTTSLSTSNLGMLSPPPHMNRSNFDIPPPRNDSDGINSNTSPSYMMNHQDSTSNEFDDIFGTSHVPITSVTKDAFDETFEHLHITKSETSNSRSPFLLHDPSHSFSDSAQQFQTSSTVPSITPFPLETSSISDSNTDISSIFTKEIQQLEAMGFLKEAIIPALNQTHGKIDEAAELLLSSTESSNHVPFTDGLKSPTSSITPGDMKNPFF